MTQASKHRHRARLAGVPDEYNDLSDYDVALVLAEGACCYCGRPSWGLELEHVTPLNRTGSMNTLRGTAGDPGAGNLRACCPDCNRRKGRKRPQEWKQPRPLAQLSLPGMPRPGE